MRRVIDEATGKIGNQIFQSDYEVSVGYHDINNTVKFRHDAASTYTPHNMVPVSDTLYETISRIEDGMQSTNLSEEIRLEIRLMFIEVAKYQIVQRQIKSMFYL